MNKKTIIAAIFAVTVLGATAQTENPRGIYMMTTLNGKMDEMPAPFEQYKICTDDITLTVSANNNAFRIYDNDRMVFNYTGAHHKNDSIKTPLVYDSNAEGFKFKWWSNYKSHMFFPGNDWCIEKYESGKYSFLGKAFFEALTGTYEKAAKNPLVDTWRFLGYVDELRDVKNALPKMHEEYPQSRFFNSFLVFTNKHMTTITSRGGHVSVIGLHGKKAYTEGKETLQVKWLAKDRIAVEIRNDFHVDWMILERVTDSTIPLNAIISQYLTRP